MDRATDHCGNCQSAPAAGDDRWRYVQVRSRKRSRVDVIRRSSHWSSTPSATTSCSRLSARTASSPPARAHPSAGRPPPPAPRLVRRRPGPPVCRRMSSVSCCPSPSPTSYGRLRGWSSSSAAPCDPCRSMPADRRCALGWATVSHVPSPAPGGPRTGRSPWQRHGRGRSGVRPGPAPWLRHLPGAETEALPVAARLAARTRSPGRRLALLSACDTGCGAASLSGDVVGWTRALLAAGVRGGHQLAVAGGRPHCLRDTCRLLTRWALGALGRSEPGSFACSYP
jgi:hypothetical protein